MTDETGTIKAAGHFDFTAHEVFMSEARVHLERASTRKIAVDLGQTQFMDSAALGMLIWLKGKCSERGMDMSIIRAHGAVRETLEIANIQKMITVE